MKVDHGLVSAELDSCSSIYIGQPADNARHFVEWLSRLEGNTLGGVKFAVFGCGNRDWQSTFQRIPRLCDTYLSEHGAERLIPRGEADAGGPDFFESFDTWEASLWHILGRVSIAFPAMLFTNMCD